MMNERTTERTLRRRPPNKRAASQRPPVNSPAVYNWAHYPLLRNPAVFFIRKLCAPRTPIHHPTPPTTAALTRYAKRTTPRPRHPLATDADPHTPLSSFKSIPLTLATLSTIPPWFISWGRLSRVFLSYNLYGTGKTPRVVVPMCDNAADTIDKRQPKPQKISRHFRHTQSPALLSSWLTVRSWLRAKSRRSKT